MIRIPSDSGQLLRRHTTSSQHATHTGEAAALPPTPPPPTIDVAVDLSQCRYEIVRTVATVDLGWHVARDAENHDGAASRDDAASSSTSSGTGRLPLVIWSDLSVTPTRLVALRHGVAKSQWVSCVIVNHISGMGELCRKRPMAQNLGLMQASFPSAFRFVPAAWDGYDEYCKWALTQPAATDGGGVPCISKPSSGCMGRGIIVAPRAHPKLWQNGECVVQRYIDNPLLVDGRKFDLRCYVFVASVDPWRVYFANHGLMRLCAQPFERPSASNASVASVHLSNYAVNKTHVGSPVKSTPRPDEHDATLRTRLVSVSTSCGDSGVGVKQSFRYTTAMLLACCEEDEYVARGTFPAFDHAAATRALLESPDRYCCGYHERIGALLHQRRCIMAEVSAEVRAEVTQRATQRVEAVWERIRLVALKALWSVLPKVEEAAASVTVRTQGRGASDVRCFELLGYDIMLDNDLQPWLIEVNHSPSWTVSSEEDGTIKRIVLRSVMQALAAERHRGPSSVKSTVKKPRRAGASEPSLRSPLTAVSPAVRPSSFTDSPMSSFGAPSPSDSLPPLPPLSGSESGSFHGGSGSVSRARRSRMMLTMPGPEYHALLAACEAEALGDDFVRVYPPPDWTGVEMQPGLADPVAESPFERRRRLDIAKRKEVEVSETSTTDAARAAHHQPPTTWRASLRDEWVEAMEVFRLQREASRLRRGVS